MKTLWNSSATLIGKLLGCDQKLSINSLSVIEDNVPGDSTIIRDTCSGLDWLNLKATAGKSYDQVKALCQPNGELHGWWYASLTEAQNLYRKFGFDLDNLSPNATPDSITHQIKTMNGFLGEIISWSGAFPETRYSGSISLTGTRCDDEKPMILQAFYQDNSDNYVLDVDGGQSLCERKCAPYISSLLVRCIKKNRA